MKSIYILLIAAAFSTVYGKYEPCTNQEKHLSEEKGMIKKDAERYRHKINRNFSKNNSVAAFYKRQHNKVQKTYTVSNAISKLQSLSPAMREILFAKWLKLFFTDDGTSPYRTSIDDNRGETKVIAIDVLPKALYVDSNGVTHSFGNVKATKKEHSITEIVEVCIRVHGTDLIFERHADEITKLCRNTFKLAIEKLPVTARHAWLAEAAGLMYRDDGKSPYSTVHREGDLYYGGSNYSRASRTEGDERPIGEYTCQKASPDAKFLDPDGKEYTKKAAWIKVRNGGADASDLLYWCAELVGVDDVLALYPEEVKAMREQRSTIKPNHHE